MARNRKLALPGSDRQEPTGNGRQRAENAPDLALGREETSDSADFRVEPENPEADLRANRLREAVQRAGGNNLVSAKAGVPVSTLGVYLRGGEWKVSAAIALAKACEVSLEWLVTGQQPAIETTQDELPAPTNDRYVMIPRYDIRASAGSGTPVDQEALLGLISFDEVFLRRHLGMRPDTLVTIEATGDSMLPTIRDGDLLLVDTSNNDIQDGRIYVLSFGGLLSVKRLQVMPDGSIAVVSDNERYPVRIIDPTEHDPLRIVGRVVYQAGPVRS